jgi:hypothetical protein
MQRGKAGQLFETLLGRVVDLDRPGEHRPAMHHSMARRVRAWRLGKEGFKRLGQRRIRRPGQVRGLQHPVV